jgi:TPR repeat protein
VPIDLTHRFRHVIGVAAAISVLATGGPALAEFTLAIPKPLLPAKNVSVHVAKDPAPVVQAPVVQTPKVEPYLVTLRKRMVAGDSLTTAELRELADSGDSLAAMKFAALLEGLEDPAVLPDAVHYYAMAVYLGRDYGISRLVALMSSRDVVLSPTRLKNAEQALVRLSEGGDAKAALALADMYAQGWPFTADPVTAQHWLAAAADNGSTDAAQRLALAALLPRSGAPADPVAVRAALDLLAASGDPGKVAIAQTLLAQLDAAEAAEPKDITQ